MPLPGGVRYANVSGIGCHVAILNKAHHTYF